MRRVLSLALLVTAAAVSLAAQSQPFIVHDTRPVITHGPYLVDPSETAVTVVWTTDTPSHGAVKFGAGQALDQMAEMGAHGLLPVGTLHAVRITHLEPGTTYRYQAVATRVVKLNAYWPEKGLAVESAPATFTTFDRGKAAVSFSVVTDTHESVARIDRLMKAIDWPTTDFLGHVGDAFDWLQTEDQLFARWLDPINRALARSKPLVFARGNHEWRGPFARELFPYVPIEEGRFYFTRDHGPLRLIVLDTGEDKPDDTNVYARLNRSEPYLQQELAWLAAEAASDPRFRTAPFRVALMHQPNWGSMPDGRARWIAAANQADVDLVIAGHQHTFARVEAGTNGANFQTLILGQDQVARVDAAASEIRVTVKTPAGELVDQFSVAPRRRPARQ
jgi:predicted phosphodiesterase